MKSATLLKTTIGFIIVFAVSFGLHTLVLYATNTQLPYSLLSVYTFHAIFSLIICLAIILIAENSTKYNDQLGFLYLFTVVFKVAFFSMAFSDVLFSEIVLNKIENLCLLIPIFVFLTYEVVIISKILNNIQVK